MSVPGVLAISVDLEIEREAWLPAQPAGRDTAVHGLVELFERLRLPATWGFADPGGSPLAARIAALDTGHEIAMVGQRAWAGVGVRRTLFGQELARRVAAARGAGLDVSTLVLPLGELSEHHDLAIKHGIRAVRQAVAAPQPTSGRGLPHTLRYGLRSIPAGLSLPGASRWRIGGGGAGVVRRAIARAAAEGGFVPLTIDAAQVLERGSGALRVVKRVLEFASQRRAQGTLAVVTLATAATLWSRQREQKPSRSILRSAA